MEGRSTKVRYHRLAEQVADDLRSQILSGALEDGAALPKEVEIREHYAVSKPSLREAMRILEAEGLISVRRGKGGGAIVHRPTSSHVAYAVALALGFTRTTLPDVAAALREVEPTCAALCASRPDRAEQVLPLLRALHEEAMQRAEDLVEVTALSRRFHEAMVSLCGNTTFALMTGAAEAIWSSHERDWASRVRSGDALPVDERLRALEEHVVLMDLIEAGDVERVKAAAIDHLTRSQMYPSSPDDTTEVDPALVKEAMR